MNPRAGRVLVGSCLIWILSSTARANAIDTLMPKLIVSPYLTPPAPSAPQVAVVRKPALKPHGPCKAKSKKAKAKANAKAKKKAKSKSNSKSNKKNTFVLQPIATTGSTTQPSVPAWLRRHRTMMTHTWYVATDAPAQTAYYWAPIPDGTIIDEKERNEISRSYGAGVVISYDPTWTSHVITADDQGHWIEQKLQINALAASPPTFAQLNVVQPATAVDPVDLVFLPSGFADTELDRYRCAVQIVTQGLLADDAFNHHAGAFNVLRMDLSSSVAPHDIHNPPQCQQLSPTTPIGAPRPATVSRDLELVELGSNLVWFCDEAKLQAVFDDIVSMRGHDPLLILVLLNTDAERGAGQVGAGVAVASLGDITGATGYQLSSHELGHALGLYDEVARLSNKTVVDYAGGGPNVITEEERKTDQIPPAWKTSCLNKPCKDTTFVRQNDPCKASGSTPADDTVGLWYGGNFRCDLYSPEGSCRMSFHGAPAFCDVCKAYIGTALDAASASTAPSLPPISGTAVTPAATPAAPPSIGGSNDTIARVNLGGFTGELVVRCLEANFGPPEGKKVVSLLPTDPPIGCGIAGTSMDLKVFEGKLNEGLKPVVEHVTDNIRGRVWNGVEKVYLHEGGMQ